MAHSNQATKQYQNYLTTYQQRISPLINEHGINFINYCKMEGLWPKLERINSNYPIEQPETSQSEGNQVYHLITSWSLLLARLSRR